jgi:hypothetical protein
VRVGLVDAVAEDVQVLVLVLHAGDLDGADEPDAVRGRDLARLGDAVDGVVVAEREELDAGLRRALDHLAGGQGAVGVQGVRLQVERGTGHIRRSIG